MKKTIFAMIMMLAAAVSASAMSYEQARERALFLTDKMAYELDLTEEQYEAAYEVNLDYLMGITTADECFGTYWTQRNLDLSYILLDWQYRSFCSIDYFYRPLFWDAGVWHFAIYSYYPTRTFFYFGRPAFVMTYYGGHSWRVNGGRSWYHGRSWVHHGGMRGGYDRGGYRNMHHGWRPGDGGNRGIRHGNGITTNGSRRDHNGGSYGSNGGNNRNHGNNSGSHGGYGGNNSNNDNNSGSHGNGVTTGGNRRDHGNGVTTGGSRREHGNGSPATGTRFNRPGSQISSHESSTRSTVSRPSEASRQHNYTPQHSFSGNRSGGSFSGGQRGGSFSGGHSGSFSGGHSGGFSGGHGSRGGGGRSAGRR